MRYPSVRWRFFLAALMGLFPLLSVLALQHWEGLQPCPLCVFQRIGVMGALLFFGVGWLHGPRRVGELVYVALASLSLLFGLASALRQLWLHWLPADQVPACGPDIGYLFENLPFKTAFLTVFQGSGDCALVHWRFLGLSLPAWSLIWFVLMLGVCCWWLVRCGRRPLIDS